MQETNVVDWKKLVKSGVDLVERTNFIVVAPTNYRRIHQVSEFKNISVTSVS